MRGTARTTRGMVTSRRMGTINVRRRHWFPRIETQRPHPHVSVGFSVLLALLLMASLVTPTATAASPVVAAWGNNSSGQLGDGTTTDRSTPVQVSGLTGVAAIAAGSEHSLGLVVDGTVRAWGNNSVGQLGDNATAGTNQTTPVQVVTSTGDLTGVTIVAAGLAHSMAVDTSASLWAWGRNLDGELGLDDSSGVAYPRAEEVIGQVTAIADGGLGAHSLAIMADGSLLAWGANFSGQVGDGTTTNRVAPVSVSGGLSATQVAAGAQHSLALLDDGTVSAWGANNAGQLGDGTTSDQSTPLPVASLSGVAEVAGGGAHSLALLDDGTVWAWGANNAGQLGDGTTTDQSAPVQVVGLSGVVDIAAGLEHSLALLDDGTVWAWGANTVGQLGEGTTTSQNTPVQVSNLTAVTAIAAGASHSLAMGDLTTTSDGNLTATVTVAAPTEACLLLTTSTLDFGTLDFDASATSPAYDLVSCSTEAQDLFAHASDAAGTEGSVWILTAPPRIEDQFSVDAATLVGTREWLTTDAIPMGLLEAEATATGQNHILEMPPAGSSGAGATMSFDIIWTAVLSSP